MISSIFHLNHHILKSTLSIFLFTIALNAADQSKEILPPAADDNHWTLVWQDEFTGEVLDESKWNILGDSVRKDGWWLKKCSTLDGKGHLRLTTTKEDDGKFGTGAVNTKGKFLHKQGFWIARMQMPKQPGFWSAFWIHSDTVGKIGDEGRDGTEIDVIEFPKRTGELNMALHWDGYGDHHKVVGSKINDKSFLTGFHTYAVSWSEKEYVYYYDGKEVWRSTAGGVSQVPQYIILSNEVGTWAGDINKAKLPDCCLIDYVRVYDLVANVQR